MRRVVVNNIVSLDGFYANAAGNPLVLEMDGAFDQANLDSISSADIVVLGGSSFDGMSAYWPFIADAPNPTVPKRPKPGSSMTSIGRSAAVTTSCPRSS